MSAVVGQRFYKTLYGQVLIATVAGVIVGHFWPAAGVAMKPFGDAFIKLVRMIIAPIIFCTVVVGIAGAAGVKTVGKAGALALVYFEVVSTMALVIGLIIVNLVQPGAGMNVDPASLDAAAVVQYVTAGKAQSATGFLLDIIPTSVVDAFARGDILQVLPFSILFGFALRFVGAAAAPIVELVDKLSGVLFTFVVLGAIAWWHAFGIWCFIKYIKEEIFIVFGTSSSESVLPRIMEKLEGLGVDRSVVGVVIPAGYSFNLDGTAIYLAIATVFIAQATDTPLGLTRQLMLLLLLLITSKGAAGVAGAALIVLAGTLSATGYIPVAGVALILGIHRFMGEAMAVTNLIGNGVAAIVVGKWCRLVDDTQLSARLLEAVAMT